MSKLIRIYVDESLKVSLENLRQELALDLKKQFQLKELIISDGFTSQVLSSKLDEKKFLKFKIKKISLNKGIIEIG